MCKKKLGRPTMEKEDRMSAVLGIRMTEDELKTVRGAAEDEGKTVTSWAREILVATALGDEPIMNLCRDAKRKSQSTRMGRISSDGMGD